MPLGNQVSSFPSENALLQMFSGQGLQRSQENALLMQQHQQQIGATETEYLARAAAGLSAIGAPGEAGETERAAAYPGAVASLPPSLRARAPAQYPGWKALQQYAALGVPAAEQYRTQGSSAAVDAIAAGVGIGPGASAAPAGGGEPLSTDKETARKQIVQRESGGDPTALNYVAREDPTAYARGATASGKYQIVNSTWAEGARLAGGDAAKYQTAASAPEAVQDQVFSALWDKYGNKPWEKGARDWVKGADGRYNLASASAQAGRGVAARTGGVDVAGPAAMPTQVPGGQGLVRDPVTGNVGTPNAGGLGTGAPVPPAVAQAAPPAAAPVAALTPPPAAAPPPEMDAHMLTARDRGEIEELRKAAKAGRLKPIEFQNEVQQRQVANQARMDKWQAQQHQAFEERLQIDNAARAARGEGRADVGLQLQIDAAKRAGLPTGYRLGPDGVATPIPGLPPPNDPNVPSGYRRSADDPNKLEFIPGGPADPSGDALKSNKQKFEQENALRDEFQKLTSDFRIVQTSYENIRSAAKAQDGAGDMSMLYNYVRLLDPTSVVRESEFAAAAASGSFGQRVQGAVERVLSGARMPDSLRQSFLHEGENLYNVQLKSHNTVADQYETLAKKNNLEPDRVVTRFARPQDQPATQAPRVIRYDHQGKRIAE